MNLENFVAQKLNQYSKNNNGTTILDDPEIIELLYGISKEQKIRLCKSKLDGFKFLMLIVIKDFETLNESSNDEDYRVRVCVAGNTNCPNNLLEKLSNDVSVHVRRAVMANICCPNSIRKKLAADRSYYVRNVIFCLPSNCLINNDIKEAVKNTNELYEYFQ